VYDAPVFGTAGQRVQVILLDTRYFRSPLKRGEKRVGGPWMPDDDPAKTMLGEAQWTWLEEQLRQPAEVRIIASSIQCLAGAAGQETWANLPRERKRLFDLIESTGAAGVLIISGDRHWAELSRIDEAVPYPLYDLTSSSFNQLHPRGTPTENPRRALPQTYHRENFGVIRIDWDQPDPTIVLEIRDLDGNVPLTKTVRLSELHR
jgi:alkaline phosphatase D